MFRAFLFFVLATPAVQGQQTATSGNTEPLARQLRNILRTVAPNTAGTTDSAVLPQFVFGGGWYSALYFTNTGSSSASFTARFFSDSDATLVVPSIGGSSAQMTVAPNATAVIEAPNQGALQQGYAAFTLPAGVRGYGVFRQSVPGIPDQEAVVPFSDASATSSVLIWDETNFTTGVAILNARPVDASATLTAWDENGAVVGTATIPLPAGTKVVGALRSLPGLAAAAGRRGSARVAVSSGGAAVLGLRFFGTSFTSIPTSSAPPLSRSAVLPQVAFGGGWYSALYFTNTTSSTVSFSVAFFDGAGAALNVASLSGPATTLSIPPHGTTIVEPKTSADLQQGYAKASLPAGVEGYGVFRQTVPGRPDQEAVVPLSDSAATSNILTWDETNFTTAVAIDNPSAQSNSVSISLWDESGRSLGTSVAALAPGARTVSALRNLPGLGGMLGHRGSAQFSVSSGSVAVLGLRFSGAAFTSIPTNSVQQSISAADMQIAQRALAQTGLAIALASTVLQSQLDILQQALNEDTGCTSLGGGGSVQANEQATVFYDSGCGRMYIYASPKITHPSSTSVAIAETASYYGPLGTSLGTMTLNEAADVASLVNLWGLGLFTPATAAHTPVQLGLYCSISSNNVGNCAGGIAQDFPALGIAIGAVTPLTLNLTGFSATAPVTFTGGGTIVTGPLGSLTLTNPGPTSLVIRGGSPFATTNASGGAAGFVLFPPIPTGWTLADASHDQQFDISVVDNTARNLTMTIKRISTGAVLATGSLDQSGTGSLTYSDGTTLPVTNWTIAD